MRRAKHSRSEEGYVDISAVLPCYRDNLLVTLLYPIPSTGQLVLIPSLPRAVALFGSPSVESGVGQGQLQLAMARACILPGSQPLCSHLEGVQPSAQSRERCSLAWDRAPAAGIADGGP